MEITAAATCCATLVDQWVRDGVRHAVVCPGSRSTPLALAVAADPRVTVHVHHDERSGAFVALGIGLATGLPAMVITTSGTAAVELHPAVVEASYAGVPMLACTADRPPELQGVGAPQTIDQHELYGRAARAYVAVPAPDDADRGRWRAMARGAFLAATRDAGPVQVNLAFRDPLVGAPGDLSPPLDPLGPPPCPAAIVDDGHLDGRRGIVVAGWGCGAPAEVHALADRLGWPVLADPRSGCRSPGTIAHADAILRAPAFAAAHRPETILRLGALPASKVVSEWFARSGATEIVVADRLDDPHRTVAATSRGSLRGVLARAGGLAPAPSGWRRSWIAAQDAAAQVLTAALDGGPVSEPAVARTVGGAVAAGSTIVVSSSMPVRDVEWYAPPRADVTVLANRGANGIDGVTSTALGVALTGRPTTLLTGDLAFLHDTNGMLGLAGRAVDVTVVVVDNVGGGIFSFLPQAEQLPRDRFEQLFGTPHTVDLAALTEAHGVPVEDVGTLGALHSAVAASPRGPRVVIVRTDRWTNVDVHAELHARVADAVDGLPIRGG